MLKNKIKMLLFILKNMHFLKLLGSQKELWFINLIYKNSQILLIKKSLEKNSFVITLAEIPEMYWGPLSQKRFRTTVLVVG